MLLIDCHTHCFPDKVAPGAVGKLAATSNLTPLYDGTTRGLCDAMQKEGVDRSLALMIATNPDKQAHINDFAIALEHSELPLKALGSVHPLGKDWLTELDRLVENGIRGIKLHPDYISMMVDDPRLYPVYGAARERGLVVYFHAGQDFISPELIHATPERILKVHKAFPGLTLVAAHLGGFGCEEQTKRLLLGEDLYIDTAFSLPYLKPERIREMLLRHDPSRVLFGSDAPWCSPKRSAQILRELALGEAYEEMLFHQNAERLLGF